MENSILNATVLCGCVFADADYLEINVLFFSGCDWNLFFFGLRLKSFFFHDESRGGCFGPLEMYLSWLLLMDGLKVFLEEPPSVLLVSLLFYGQLIRSTLSQYHIFVELESWSLKTSSLINNPAWNFKRTTFWDRSPADSRWFICDFLQCIKSGKHFAH